MILMCVGGGGRRRPHIPPAFLMVPVTLALVTVASVALTSPHAWPFAKLTTRTRRWSLSAIDSGSSLESAVSRVHAAAAAFGSAHSEASKEWTTALLQQSRPQAIENLMDRQIFLFDDLDQCLPLRKAMDALLRLEMDRSRATSVLRPIIDARIEKAGVDVRALAAEFGLRHARVRSTADSLRRVHL